MVVRVRVVLSEEGSESGEGLHAGRSASMTSMRSLSCADETGMVCFLAQYRHLDPLAVSIALLGGPGQGRSDVF